MAKKEIEWGISELMNLKLCCDNWPVDKDIVTSFIDILISNAKARTGIPEENIKEYNKEFYDYLDTYFNEKRFLSVGDNSEEFKKLCLMFKVPAIKNNLRSEKEMLPGDDTRQKIIHTGNIMDNSKGCGIPTEHGGIGFIPEKKTFTHKDCLEMFDKLSAEEKIKFIMEFQNVEIKLSPSEILVFKSC